MVTNDFALFMWDRYPSLPVIFGQPPLVGCPRPLSPLCSLFPALSLARCLFVSDSRRYLLSAKSPSLPSHSFSLILFRNIQRIEIFRSRLSAFLAQGVEFELDFFPALPVKLACSSELRAYSSELRAYSNELRAHIFRRPTVIPIVSIRR